MKLSNNLEDAGLSLKIDLDTKNFGKYCKRFSYVYYLIYSTKQIKIMNSSVYLTRHGIHIYFYTDNKKELSNEYRNLLECLLGSDIIKQVYYFVENVDILFIKKDGYKCRYSDVKSKRLNEIIDRINKRKYTIINKTIKI